MAQRRRCPSRTRAARPHGGCRGCSQRLDQGENHIGSVSQHPKTARAGAAEARASQQPLFRSPVSPQPPASAAGRAWALLCRHLRQRHRRQLSGSSGARSGDLCPAELGFVWRATTRMKAAAGGGPACLLPSPPGSGEARGTKPAGKKGARSWRGVLRRAGAGADGSSAGSTAGEGFLQKEAAFPPFSRRLNPRRAFRASQTLPGVQTMLLSGGVGRKNTQHFLQHAGCFCVCWFWEGRGRSPGAIPGPVQQDRGRPPSPGDGALPSERRPRNSAEDPRVNFISKTATTKKKKKNTPKTKHYPLPDNDGRAAAPTSRLLQGGVGQDQPLQGCLLRRPRSINNFFSFKSIS